MKRSGFADLPLHGGRVPEWLSRRMTMLGTAVTEAIVYDYGTSAFLSRLSDPFWFQAFGAVLGMDWHSSGITTSVMGALKPVWLTEPMSSVFTSAEDGAGSRATRQMNCDPSRTGGDSTVKLCSERAA